MPAGFQSGPDILGGEIYCDLTQRIAKLMGSLSVGASFTGAATTGSVVDSRFTAYAGTVPFAAVIASTFFQLHQHPTISIVGDTLTWTFPAGSALPDTTIIYGIF
jgi:hypothetical protein